MSTATVSTPRVGSGRKNDRGSYSMPQELKQDIEAAASESGMYASTYLELLLQSEFQDGLPRMVMMSIDPNGNKREIPVGILRASNVQLMGDQKTVRATYTLSPSLKTMVEEAAEQSHLSASAYLRRLIEMKFSAGLPRFGVAMFDLEGLSDTTDGTLDMA